MDLIQKYIESSTSLEEEVDNQPLANRSMDPGAGAGAPGAAEASSSGAPGAAEASSSSGVLATQQPEDQQVAPPAPPPPPQPPSRYESQKRRDWNTFLQYLNNHKPPLTLPGCSGANVIEFLKYLDQFGKTKVHAAGCPYFGHPAPPASCACPLMQAWGSLDALIGRLRAAYEESGGRPESNPFAHRAVRVYLREVRESQAKARGIPYEKKKRKRSNPPLPAGVGASSSGAGGDEGGTRGGESSSTAAAAATASEAATSASIVVASSSPAAEGSGAPAAEGSSPV